MTSTSGPGAMPAIDVGQLLTIDVGSELRKLSSAQMQGSWQLPAELVRRAIHDGARRIQVTLGRLLVITDDGAGLSSAVMEQVAVLLDRRLSTEDRHRALTTLERGGELALLALLGVDPLKELQIHSRLGGELVELELREGAAPRLRSRAAAGPSTGTSITLRAPGLDRRQAAQWLASVARFSPAVVTIDGTEAPRGFPGSLIEADLSAPLRGRVALVEDGDSAHAHLLADGLVTAQVTIPGVPSFEAAVELGSPAGDLSPSRLRDALVPFIPTLVDQAVALLARAAPGAAAGPEARRARLARLTLQSVRRNLRREELQRLRLFRTVSAAGPALLDLSRLRSSATVDAEGTPALLALSPEQRVDRYALGNEPILLADDAERSLLADVLGVRFRPPSLRGSSHSPAALARGLARAAAGWLSRTLDLVRHPLRPRIVPDGALTDSERVFLRALSDHLRGRPAHLSGSVAMCSGQGPLRRQGRGGSVVWLLPRENPLVLASLRAFSEDVRWIRIVALALHATLAPKG